MCTVKDPVSTGKEFFEHTLKLLSQTSRSNSTMPMLEPSMKIATCECEDDKYQTIMDELKKVSNQLETLKVSLDEAPKQIVAAIMATMGTVPAGQQQQQQVCDCDKDGIEKWIRRSTSSISSSSSLFMKSISLEEDFERLTFDMNEALDDNVQEAVCLLNQDDKQNTPNLLFAHWQSRFNKSSEPSQGAKFLFASPMSLHDSSSLASLSEKTLSPPPILPYNANIDLSIWLK